MNKHPALLRTRAVNATSDAWHYSAGLQVDGGIGRGMYDGTDMDIHIFRLHVTFQQSVISLEVSIETGVILTLYHWE